MTAGLEELAALEWLHARLSGDAALVAELADGADGIHDGSAPDGAPLPAVIVRPQGPGTVIGAMPTDVVAVSQLWQVKAVVRGRSFEPARAAAARIYAVLNGASGVAASGEVFGCVREQPFALREDTDTANYRHLGGLYRLAVQ